LSVISIVSSVFAQEILPTPVPETAVQPQSPTPLPVIQKKQDISELSIEALLNTEFTVATAKPLTMRENPAVISIITEEEIRKSGARDLIDVLRQVPGFEFGTDVWGTVGAGFRGLWAYEGKLLVLLDGHPLVERLYTTVPFGNRVSLDQIRRVEIIRGPGSAMYGREAELAVINIVTRVGEELEGGDVAYKSGYMGTDVARENLEASVGHRWDSDTYLGAAIFKGVGQRTDRRYTDVYGTSLNLSGQQSTDPESLLAHFRHGDFNVRFFMENYHLTYRDSYDLITPLKLDNNFKTYSVIADQRIRLSDRVTLTPEFHFTRQYPWQSRASLTPGDPSIYMGRIDRYKGEIKLKYDPIDTLSLLLGATYEFDDAQHAPEDVYLFANGEKGVQYHDIATFAEAVASLRPFTLTVGGRYEHHSEGGSSAVPRAALTAVWDRYHVKAMVSQAFRVPAAEYFAGAARVGLTLESEKATIVEAEGGVQLTEEMFLSANFFDITIKHPIVYQYDTATGLDSYQNLGKVGTRGVEAEYRYRGRNGFGSLSYSFYTKTKDDSANYYSDPTSGDRFVGFPSHKITAHGSWQITPNLSINPSLAYTSARGAYTSVDPGTGLSKGKQLDGWFLLNLYLLYEDLFLQGLDLGAGVFDLLNADPVFVQPYDGYHAPLPGPSPEFVVNVKYAW
jgi:outer membrane receptor for ferrienterochelin and colicin